jgi:hypothetical protein
VDSARRKNASVVVQVIVRAKTTNSPVWSSWERIVERRVDSIGAVIDSE